MWSTGINRNIVECKESFCVPFSLGCISINRNIVECKDISRNIGTHRLTKVLIETLWNVKEADNSDNRPVSGINRNIVECKDVSKSPQSIGDKSINRNIVECKVSLV